MPTLVGNLTRNTIISSAHPDDSSRRGHILIMTRDSIFENVLMKDLGRTDRTKLDTDPQLGEGQRIVQGPAGYNNPRALYVWHTHKSGNSAQDLLIPLIVKGCVVDGSPGWGS